VEFLKQISSTILRIFEGWAKFVKATKLCLEWEITNDKVDEIEILFRKFVIHYERYYLL